MRMHSLCVDVEAGYEVVERIKNTWLVRNVRVSCGSCGGFGGMFDLFKNRCQRARFDLRYRWCRY